MVHVGRNAGTVSAVGLAPAGYAFSFLFFPVYSLLVLGRALQSPIHDATSEGRGPLRCAAGQGEGGQKVFRLSFNVV